MLHLLRQLWQHRLIRQLFILYIVFGLLPIVFFAVLPTLVQLQASREQAETAGRQLEEQAAETILEQAQAHAQHYDAVFQNLGLAAYMLADVAANSLASETASVGICCDPPQMDVLLIDGWRVSSAQSPYGFLASPLADLETAGQALTRQRALAALVPVMEATVTRREGVRTAFFLTEDQTLWLYPNRLHAPGAPAHPSSPEITSRSYYRRTREVVFSDPYLERVPVVTVAAPIWDGDEFAGMAGLDFSLETLIEDMLNTAIGEGGSLFLLGTEGQLIAMSTDAALALLASPFIVQRDALVDHTLYEASTPWIRGQLEAIDLPARLQLSSSLSRVELATGENYLALARIPHVPWHVAVLQPVTETAAPMVRLIDTLTRSWQSLRLQLALSGAVFLAVMVAGGLIVAHRLALPVSRLATGAVALQEGHLGHRVPVGPGNDELANLSRTFNEMAASLQDSAATMLAQQQTLRETLEFREREFAVVNQLVAVMNRPEGLAGRWQKMLQITLTALEVDVLAMFLIDDNSGDLEWAAAAAGEEDKRVIVAAGSDLIDQALAARLLRKGEMLYIPAFDAGDTDLAATKRVLYQSLGFRRAAMLAIHSRQRTLGLLLVLSRKTEQVPQRQVTFLQEIVRLMGVLVEHGALQEQQRELLVMEERRRLARELHDSATQSMFTLSLAAKGLQVTLDGVPGKHQEALALLDDQIQVVQKELRSLIDELRPLELQDGRLDLELRRQANRLQRVTDIDVHLSLCGDATTIPRAVARNLHRIAQEALSNLARHAQATDVTISLHATAERVELTIHDNGVGFNLQEVSVRENGSLGLSSMRERAEMMGGMLRLRTAPAGGTTVTTKVVYGGRPDEE